MSTTKQKNERLTSPIGIAVWPKLQKPDYKFDKLGAYSVSLKLDPKDEKAKAFIEKVEKAHSAALKKAQADNKGKKIKAADSPVREELNSDGDATGLVLVKAKLAARVEPKSGAEPWDQRPALFDINGAPLKKDVQVGGGSVIRMQVEVNPFWIAAVGAGVSLRLKAVKVLKLVEFNGGDQTAYGFGDEDYEDDSTSDSSSDDSSDDDSSSDDKSGSESDDFS